MVLMAAAQSSTTILAIAAVIVMATGAVLTRRGRPFATALLTVHKLVALAAVAFVGYSAFEPVREGLLASGQRVALLTALVLCIAVFGTGGVVSAKHASPSWAVWVHRVGSWLTVVAVALSARGIV